MSIKLAVLKSGEDIIADVKEIMSEDNVVGYLLHKPHSVLCEEPLLVEEEDEQNGSIQIRLRPWLILSKDDKVPVRPDWLVTIVEPVDMLKEMYEEKVNGQTDQTDSTDEQ
tara:strand:- start:1113 stop:1445 length:333 start_codon:yes stop_codon:yes gene_type:complete